MINNVIHSRPTEGLLVEDHCVLLSYNKRQTVVKYFLLYSSKLKYLYFIRVFSLENVYFTTFQSIMSYLLCTTFNLYIYIYIYLYIYLPLILKNIKHSTFLYSSKSLIYFYLK